MGLHALDHYGHSGGSSSHRSRGLRGPRGGAPLIERELVAKHQWLTAADVTEALTYQTAAGSTGPQVVAYRLQARAGLVRRWQWWRSYFRCPHDAGAGGRLCSVTALPALQPAMHGLMGGIVGLLLATTYRLGKVMSPTASPGDRACLCRGRSRPGRQCGGNCGGADCSVSVSTLSALKQVSREETP